MHVSANRFSFSVGYFLLVAFLAVSIFFVYSHASERNHPAEAISPEKVPIQVQGVFPRLAIVGEHAGRTEMGIGALVPWANRLWVISYVAHITGSAGGLYEIDEQMNLRRHPASVIGTFANRMIHDPSDQAIIGPHLIDIHGNVRTITALEHHRLTATMQHLSDPENKVYFLTMEGLLFEVNVHSLEAHQLFDLTKELELPAGVAPHFKGGYTDKGRVVVANNSYDERDFLGKLQGGRLAEWDGRQWTILEKKPFVEVYGKNRTGDEYGHPIFATGWDNASAILKLFAKGRWTTYRLPRSGHSYDHAWNTEWMRIREAQTERFLMDLDGIFYEVPVLVYGGKTWGIRPICSHLRLVPDFCHWRGLFVLASDQTDHAVGQPQSGLWFGNIDDLWRFGKPQGTGGPWCKTAVKTGEVSDPYLMAGFDQKGVHLTQESSQEVEFKLEVDFLGDGTWKTYQVFRIPAGGYVHHEFPAGFGAEWVRITVNRECVATAQFVYR